jgi:hypothetical protein
MLMRSGIIGIILLTVAFTSEAIEISTEHEAKSELATVKLLQALRQSHDLRKWEFTNKININKKSIPHSHPLLTLHTRHTNREQTDLLLSTYIHEQIHWHLDKNKEGLEKAVEELKTVFKDVPVGYPEGGNSEFWTYGHILVCYLELEAVAELLSSSRYDRVVEFWKSDHYTWIYKQVTEHKDKISKIIDKYGLKIV